ncbi:hypothetical protein B0H16DRAFT_1852861 [Mycena metata]|uniref:Uncharacterized protein n=1 Tax=Mycena metata TaxID=1033252 RepID=A0AAD7IP35_9AGAR|nr:hypothetical protein B0H16DRAFT_1852861 [Mycena metata]
MSASRSGEKTLQRALEALEDGGRKRVDCQVLLENTFHTFSALERWETADSKISSVRSTIELIRQQGHGYFDTLVDSIVVATKLNEFAQDMVALVGFLLDPADKPDEILDFVADMRTYTNEALEKSKHMSSTYRNIREEINQISAGIPNQMSRLERREQRVIEKKELLERRIGRAKVFKNVGTAAVAIVSAVSIVAFPPMMLIIPVGIPIAILAVEAYEHRSSKALMKREDEIMDCRIGLQQLKDMTTCLAVLAQHVDSMVEFWLRSDTMLDTISSGVGRIKGNTSRVKLRLKAIKQQWKDAGEKYTDYATKAGLAMKLLLSDG